jgi:hypothetical protein
LVLLCRAVGKLITLRQLPGESNMRKILGSFLVAGCITASLLLTGCNSGKIVTETYQRPAEINMVGRENIQVDGLRGEGSDAINSRLKSALQAKGFTIVDLSVYGARQTGKTLTQTGDAEESGDAKIARAAVTIKGRVTRHEFAQNVQQAVQTDGSGRKYPVYKTLGSAVVETSFDVVEIDTLKTITSANITGSDQSETNYETQPATISPASLFPGCYDQIVQQFMQKIAPFNESVNHTVYPVQDVPQTLSGIALLESRSPTKATTEFEAALATAKSMPKVSPKTLGQIAHNIAVANEWAGKFDKAAELYTAAAQQGVGINESYNIARCQQRLAEREQLRKQGVTIK